MVLSEQRLSKQPLTIDREAGERAARESLRAQVTRLERQLSEIVVAGFPHIPVAAPIAADIGGRGVGGSRVTAPHLPTLGELERQRDALAQRVQETRRRAGARAEFERRARAQLERMRLEPGRYKFTRLPVRDLGERGCGVWEVRPRLGLIGMLAGWWELKLSSGCPLGWGPRTVRGPANVQNLQPRADR